MSAAIKPRHEAPSAYRMEAAMSCLLAARDRLLSEDPELQQDEHMLADILGSDPETCDSMELLDRVLRAVVHAESMADAADARMKEVASRKARYSNRAVTLRSAAFSALDALGIPKRELPDLTATISAGRVAVQIIDEAALPDRFVKVERSPKKSDIGAALRAGEDVPGAVMANSMPVLSLRKR